MQGGHYTAYVRTRPHKPTTMADATNLEQQKLQDQEEQRLPEQLQSAVDEGGNVSGASSAAATSSEFDTSSSSCGQWYFISDSRVRTATENEVLKSQAYLLFYERLPPLTQRVK